MSLEQELLQKLRENQDSALRCLAVNDMVALRALAEQEARYMDYLRVIWKGQ
jgi:hypothetical protein